MEQPVPHHRKPDGVLQVILIGIESLGRIERRVDIDQLHIAHVFFGKLGHTRQRLKNVARFAMDEQIVSLGFKIGIFGILVFI